MRAVAPSRHIAPGTPNRRSIGDTRALRLPWAAPAAHAFTLIELTIVVVILALVAAIAVPRFAGAAVRARVSAAADRVAADIRLTRTEAMKVSTVRKISFDSLTLQYTIAGVRHLDTAAGNYVVKLAEEPYLISTLKVDLGGDNTLVFDGFGVPDSGGTIELLSGAYKRTVTVQADAGVASVSVLQ